MHDLSIIQYLFDDEPVAVSATAASHVPGNPENMAHITLFFPSSCIAQISVNWLSPVKIRQTFIGGSRKMIMYDDVEPTEKIKVYDKGITINGSEEAAHQLRIGYRAGDMWAPHLSTKEALLTETEHLIDCVRRGTAPISGGITGWRVVELLEATSGSIAARGAPVVLDQWILPERVMTCDTPARSVRRHAGPSVVTAVDGFGGRARSTVRIGSCNGSLSTARSRTTFEVSAGFSAVSRYITF